MQTTAFQSHYIRYKHVRYNLFREESEGYAKVITELTFNPLTPSNESAVCEKIQSLIGSVSPFELTSQGFFELDPNRVLSLVLDAFEEHIDNPSYVTILNMFHCDHHLDLLVLRLQYYQNPETEEITPLSFFKLIAALIKHKFFTWEQIYPYVRLKSRIQIDIESISNSRWIQVEND